MCLPEPEVDFTSVENHCVLHTVTVACKIDGKLISMPRATLGQARVATTKFDAHR